jgi:uncharacterized membrane protein YgaE (UPF0421/DUF939 family)
MHIDRTEPSAGAVAPRMVLAAVGLLVALLVVAAIVRPDMMMSMLHSMMQQFGAGLFGH